MIVQSSALTFSLIFTNQSVVMYKVSDGLSIVYSGRIYRANNTCLSSVCADSEGWFLLLEMHMI